jgi:radical SAM superfamily enzyme YgiQ (UPF0313 family)
MRILFARPAPPPDTIGLQHIMVVEPLELEVMATVAGPTHTCMIVDMILEKQPLEKILLQFRPQVFCTTGYITHMPVIKAYCQLAKKLLPGVHTVVGGVHTEKFPEDTDDPAIDYRVVRNATRMFPLLLKHIEQGATLPAGVLAQGQPLISENLPAFDFYFPKPFRNLTAKYRKKYFYVFHSNVALLKTSFGCPYTCNFCFCRQITDGHYHARPLDEVMEELKEIKEKEVYIVDDDFLLSPARLTAFIKRVKEENIRKRYLVYGRADFIASHPDIIGQLHDIGLRTVIVGIESFSDAELQHFEKRTSQAINEQALQVLHSHGVECYGAVITSPDWSEEDFEHTGTKLLQLGMRFVNLQPLTPLKGTGIEVPDKDLVIARSDFPKWDLAHVVIRPTRMSMHRYYQNLLRLYERILFSPRNMLHHALHEPPAMQWKLARGLMRVHRQYKERIKQAKLYDAQNTLYTSYTV